MDFDTAGSVELFDLFDLRKDNRLEHGELTSVIC
jgi:hypothetical protein